MSRWSQCRLIDLLSRIDLKLLEEYIPEADLEDMRLLRRRRHGWGRRWIALVSGIAACSIALAGTALVLGRRRSSPGGAGREA